MQRLIASWPTSILETFSYWARFSNIVICAIVALWLLLITYAIWRNVRKMRRLLSESEEDNGR